MNDKSHDSNSRDVDDARLTAYALGQLDPADRAAVERWLGEIGGDRRDEVRRTIDETRLVAAGLVEAARHDPEPPSSPSLRAAVESRLREVEEMESQEKPESVSVAERRPSRRRWLALAAAACLLAVAVPAAFWIVARRPIARYEQVATYGPRRAAEVRSHLEASGGLAAGPTADALVVEQKRNEAPFEDPAGVLSGKAAGRATAPNVAGRQVMVQLEGAEASNTKASKTIGERYLIAGREEPTKGTALKASGGSGSGEVYRYAPRKPAPKPGIDAYRGARLYSGQGGQAGPVADIPPMTDQLGTRVYPAGVLAVPQQSAAGGEGQKGLMGGMGGVPVGTAEDKQGLGEPRQPLLEGGGIQFNRIAGPQTEPGAPGGVAFSPDGFSLGVGLKEQRGTLGRTVERSAPGTEQYEPVVENEFLSAAEEPLSTFSIDVDTASYANVRRFLVGGRLPPPGAVRIEEMVNYFPYDYPEPDGEHPFSVNMEVAQCPWNGDHRLVRIGLKGHEIHRKERGPSNLVFLLDVSGSMSDQNKLPLVKEAMRMLVDQLGEDDRVAIVTYAGNAGLALESTNGESNKKIVRAIDALHAGGSTHGSAGIQMAYDQASEHFLPDGTNRVILATDGDLNVGVTDDDQLVKLIRQKAKSGVFLTVLGFGTGNLKDAKLEKLADHGNGSYAYIDSLREAYKVLVQQATGSLITIAKDVKIQVEFNPAEVDRYRLVGYENRLLAARDFANDKKDAGEIGAGHTVTALYEIVPQVGERGEGTGVSKEERSSPLTAHPSPLTSHLCLLRLRYKQPQADTSELMETTLKDSGKRFGEASDDFRFAAAVASFGLVLRGSLVDKEASNLGLAAVEEFAAGALGEDSDGYRQEFVGLVRQAEAVCAARPTLRSVPGSAAVPGPVGPGVSASGGYVLPQAAQPSQPAPSAEPQQPSRR